LGGPAYRFLTRRGGWFMQHTLTAHLEPTAPPNGGLERPPHPPHGFSCRPHIAHSLLCRSAAQQTLCRCSQPTYTPTPAHAHPSNHIFQAVDTLERPALTRELIAGPTQVLGRDGVPYPALPWPSGASIVEKPVLSPTAPPPPDSQFSDHSWHGGGHWCTTHVGAGPPGYGAGLTALWHHVGSI
jgi:hypothetical protein